MSKQFNTDKLDQILQSYVDLNEPHKLHNVSFCAMDRNGTLYASAYGYRDLEGTKPASLDSVYWAASMTKLCTAVATLIAVEKGLVTLDENVRNIVPELADLDILDGFDEEGKPVLRKCTSPISLRQLLSHTSGFCYDNVHEGLKKWSAYIGRTDDTFSGSYKGYTHPLIFEPGHGWSYGPDLESFMETHIWGKLGMRTTTFRPETRPDTISKQVQLAYRGPDGKLNKQMVPFANPAIDCCGGVGLYSTPADFAKLLSALLRNNGTLFSPETFESLLKPHVDDLSFFVETGSHFPRPHRQTWPKDAHGSFGASSAINRDSFPGRRAAGSANWQGMPGIHTWLDPTTGLAGLLFTQILPPGDSNVTECFCALEAAVYEAAGPSLTNGNGH